MGPCPEEVLHSCLVEKGVERTKFAFFQLEGVVFVDPDTTASRLVLKRSVSFKESKGKKDRGPPSFSLNFDTAGRKMENEFAALGAEALLFNTIHPWCIAFRSRQHS